MWGFVLGFRTTTGVPPTVFLWLSVRRTPTRRGVGRHTSPSRGGSVPASEEGQDGVGGKDVGGGASEVGIGRSYLGVPGRCLWRNR